MPIIPSTTGAFSASGAVRKCSSTSAEPGEELGEALGTDGDHQRQPDRRVDRVAATDPLPEAEHVVGVDAEGGHLVGVGADGDEVPGDGVLAEGVDEPGPGRAGVGQRLDRRERLRRDDEQRLGRVEVGEGVGDRRRRRRWTRSGTTSSGWRERAAAPGRPSPARGRNRRCRC